VHLWPVGVQRAVADVRRERLTDRYREKVRTHPLQRGPIHKRLVRAIDAYAQQYERIIRSVPNTVRWHCTYEGPEFCMKHFRIREHEGWIETMFDRLPATVESLYNFRRR
jgi:hypothetical protein